MKQVYLYDKDGKFVEPVMISVNNDGLYELPKNCTDVELPQPNWKPVFDGEKWNETITEGELEPLKNPTPVKSDLEILKEENESLRKRVEETENAILLLMDLSL